MKYIFSYINKYFEISAAAIFKEVLSRDNF